MEPPRYVSPAAGLAGRIEEALANAEGLRGPRRALFSRLPFPVLVSDVRDVVYANWLVEARALAAHVPRGVKVREVGGRTILTLLAYDHGHFGPAFAGALRGIFPSPRQANWRLYVESIGGHAPPANTVLFLANLFDSLLYALGTRLFSDVMLSQRAARFEHRLDGSGWTSSVQCPGGGPSWYLRGDSHAPDALPEGFDAFFGSYADAIRTLCLQDAAIAPVSGGAGLALSEIDLPIPLDAVRSLSVEDYRPCALLQAWGAVAPPFCFHVPAVRFRALSERLIDHS